VPGILIELHTSIEVTTEKETPDDLVERTCTHARLTPILVSKLLLQPGAALNVSEEEGAGASREWRHGEPPLQGNNCSAIVSEPPCD